MTPTSTPVKGRGLVVYTPVKPSQPQTSAQIFNAEFGYMKSAMGALIDIGLASVAFIVIKIAHTVFRSLSYLFGSRFPKLHNASSFLSRHSVYQFSNILIARYYFRGYFHNIMNPSSPITVELTASLEDSSDWESSDWESDAASED